MLPINDIIDDTPRAPGHDNFRDYVPQRVKRANIFKPGSALISQARETPFQRAEDSAS